MALNPIEVAYQTGATLYFLIHHKNGTVWNNNTLAFEAYNSSNWADYAIALTEQSGSGYYKAAMPVGVGNNLVTECTYNQQGGSPTISDAVSGPIGIGQSQGVDLAAVDHSEQGAVNMGVNLGLLVIGAAVSGTLSTTQMTTNLSSTQTGLYVGRLVIFTSGVLSGQASTITAYNGSTKLVSFGPTIAAPSAADTFLII